MIRRRRPLREIAFSFDSFLDVVANVVGVIIRLILVVWVGARSYSSIQSLPPPPPTQAASEAGDEADPLRAEIARRQRELEEAEAKLLDQLRQTAELREKNGTLERGVAALDARRRVIERDQAGLKEAGSTGRPTAGEAALSLQQLRERGEKLAEEIRELEKLPPAKKTLRYRTPVSHPVQSDEYHFECRQGRVTFIDVGAMLDEVKQGIHDQGQLLRSQWQVNGMTQPIGAFRLRYVIERERGALDAVGSATAPDPQGNFRYGVGSWEVEPLALVRGEDLTTALRGDSQFRMIADGLDPNHAVVTFWVYPDSFGLYRQLRDFLYDRDVVVAGRPLPDGVPIASSRRGSVSRGQ